MKNIFVKTGFILSLIALIMILSGCGGTTKEITEIKPVVIYPPVIQDSLKAAVVTDTVIIGNTIVNQDTVILVKYFPQTKSFALKVKPDSIIYWDTVKVLQPPVEKIVETPLLAKVGLVFIGIVLSIIGFFIIKITK